MRSLKCTECGGALKIAVTQEGMALGTCRHCGAEYLLDRQRKQYVVVEHRFAGDPAKRVAPQSAKTWPVGLILLAVAVVVLLAGGPVLSALVRDATAPVAADDAGGRVVFNVGSEGSSPGQLRAYPANVGIDALGRAVVNDLDGRTYVFGPDGGFIANHPKAGSHTNFVAVLPDGGVIMHDSGPSGFARYEPVSGKIGKPHETSPKDTFDRAYIPGAVTPDGGFAVYATQDDSHDQDLDPSLPLPDAVILYGSDMRERRRVTGLLTQAIASDPMVQNRPEVSSMAVNGAGNIFLSVMADEDTDTRGGIYEFNADGVFQRRLDIEMSFWGRLASGPDGSLWYGDPWRGDLQRATAAGVQRIDLSALARAAEQDIGNVVGVATYPNGDVGVITNNHHLVRIAVDPD